MNFEWELILFGYESMSFISVYSVWKMNFIKLMSWSQQGNDKWGKLWDFYLYRMILIVVNIITIMGIINFDTHFLPVLVNQTHPQYLLSTSKIYFVHQLANPCVHTHIHAYHHSWVIKNHKKMIKFSLIKYKTGCCSKNEIKRRLKLVKVHNLNWSK